MTFTDNAGYRQSRKKHLSDPSVFASILIVSPPFKEDKNEHYFSA
jgi:hypothetical protein